MPLRSVPVKQADLLTAFVNYLIANVAVTPPLTEMTCFLSLHPFPPKIAVSDTLVMVCPQDGQFPSEQLDGGMCHEDTTVLIKIVSRVLLDEVGADVFRLTHSSLGMIEMKSAVLKAVTNKAFQVGGNDVLRNLLFPIDTRIQQTEDETLGQIVLPVALSFDHDLS